MVDEVLFSQGDGKLLASSFTETRTNYHVSPFALAARKLRTNDETQLPHSVLTLMAEILVCLPPPQV